MTDTRGISPSPAQAPPRRGGTLLLLAVALAPTGPSGEGICRNPPMQESQVKRANGNVSVWICPAEYKPSPVSAKVIGFAGDRAELRAKNTVFSGGRIRLFGARAEDLGFQVVFERTGAAAVAGLEVEVSAFSGGMRPKVPRYLIGYTSSRGARRKGRSAEIPWSPDACVPFETPGAERFSIPVRLDGLPTPPRQKTQAVWVDVHVPRSARPGKYTAVVTARREGKTIARFPLELTVWPFQIPVRRAFEGEFNAYRCAFLNHWGLDPRTERYIALEHAFLRLCDDHRTVMNVMPYHGQQGFAYPGYAPLLEGAGKTLRVKDWSVYDKRFDPVCSGRIFRDRRPVSAMYLPFNLEWPEPLRNWHPKTREGRWHSLWVENLADYPRKAYNWKKHTQAEKVAFETAYKNVLRQWIAHARKKGWTRTEFQIYFNQKPQAKKPGSDLGPNRATNCYDEWQDKDDLLALKYYLDLTRQVTAGLKDINVVFRIDISRFSGGPGMERYGRPGDQFDKLGGLKLLDGVNCWYVGMHSYRRAACRRVCRDLSERGISMNVYGQVPAINADTAAGSHRLMVPMWIGGIRRYLAWTGTMWDFKDPFGASMGTLHLIYPGKPLGYDGPVASIRLKHWRRTILDIEYLALAAGKIGREKVAALAQETLKANTPKAWLALRRRLAGIIAGSS